MDLSEREALFTEEVYGIGNTIYTKLMLERFIEHWTEPTHSKKKLRFQREPTWDTSRRLKTWARNNFDKIECYLSNEQSIAQKKRNFAITLEPFLQEYGKETLNEFYRHWVQLENVPGSTRLAWEIESVWDTSTRLQKWVKRKPTYERK